MSSESFKLVVLGVMAATAVLAVFASLNAPPKLYVNGASTPGLSTRVQDGRLYVGLPYGARILGGEAEGLGPTGATIKSGPDQSSFLAGKELIRRGSKYFADLESLLESLNLSPRKRGKSYYVSTSPSELTACRLSGDALLLRFDGFLPYTVQKRTASRIVLNLFNVSLSEKYLSNSGEKSIRKVEITPTSPSSARAVLSLRGAQNFETSGLALGDKFRLLLVVGGRPDQPSLPRQELEMEEDLPQGISYHTVVRRSSAIPHTLHYVKVKDWSQNYRLQTAVPGSGIGTCKSLSSLVRGQGGVAGINANFFDMPTGTPIGLVVRDGNVLSDNWGRRAVLAVDSFGEAHFLRPSVKLELLDGARSIPVNGINRPLGTDEVLAYTSGFSEPNLPGYDPNRKVVALRNGRVVSSGNNALGEAGNYDYLLVATGSESSKLRGLDIGEKVTFKWSMEPYVPMMEEAVSAGPLLIRNGRNALNISRESFTPNTPLVRSRAVRSVVATTEEGSLLLMVIKNQGISLTDLPGVLLSAGLGIDSAMALDGGNSAGLAFRRGGEIELIGGGRDIPVALVLTPK